MGAGHGSLIQARRIAAGRFPKPRRRHPAAPVLPGAARLRGLRIGLLGGSFNPAHEGHLHISLEAMKRLGLDRIWWLVSPQNPLKSARGMAPLGARLARARSLARDARIEVTALEETFGTRYTVDTLERLREAAPGVHFVWIIGADNLANFTKWKRWPDIMKMVPLAIMDRAPYSLEGLAGLVARRYRHCRLPTGAQKALATKPTPVWTFVRQRRHPQSATKIRQAQLLAAGAHSIVSAEKKE